MKRVRANDRKPPKLATLTKSCSRQTRFGIEKKISSTNVTEYSRDKNFR